MDRLLISMLICLVLVGCQSTSDKVVPLPQICVAKQGDVRPDFTESLMAGLKFRQIILTPVSEEVGCEWLLTYGASWAWPHSAYMQSAQLTFSRHNLTLSQQAYPSAGGGLIAQPDDWISAWIESGICENPEYLSAIEEAVISRPWFDLLPRESLPCPAHHL
ncbi:hypothetical protein L2750_00075 [Shewanella submarina]|uniref:Uncharacterized protein n=1 Tax=Shewanella submarina TaxID=2016376 RepID=A0ABV7GHV7_9GAMM|nr:hypothetical protein [Shewanella submarina]MCL1035553.1 hypothetical protein [Shewanella submarina]